MSVEGALEADEQFADHCILLATREHGDESAFHGGHCVLMSISQCGSAAG